MVISFVAASSAHTQNTMPPGDSLFSCDSAPLFISAECVIPTNKSRMHIKIIQGVPNVLKAHSIAITCAMGYRITGLSTVLCVHPGGFEMPRCESK